MHIKPFQAIYLRQEFITSAESFFTSVKEEYNDYFQSGFFAQAGHEAFYIYQIQTPRRYYTGLVACVDIRDYLEGHIRKHEHTLPEQEQKQMQLLLRRRAAVKPILLAYPQVERIDRWIRQFTERHSPFMSISFNGKRQTHCFWEVRDAERIAQLQELFNCEVAKTYIADGHHRSSTLAMMHERHLGDRTHEDYSRLFCALFPSNELEVLEFNRVVEVLDECSPTWFMARIAQLFDIEILSAPEKPHAKHEVVMLINREWYRLRWKAHVLEEFRDQPVVLDTIMLNEKVLKEILNIQDERTDGRVDYVEGPLGLDGLRRKTVRGESHIGFCLYPISLDDLFKLADAGRVLPPKSTWFEPRMKNGLIVQGLENRKMEM